MCGAWVSLVMQAQRPSSLVFHRVIAVEEEGLKGIEQEVSQVLVQVGGQDAAVIAVRDTPSIHGFSNEVPQRAPGQLVITVVVCLHSVA